MKKYISLFLVLLLSLTVTAAASRVNVSVSTPSDGNDDFGYTLPPDTTSTDGNDDAIHIESIKNNLNNNKIKYETD